MQQCPKCLECEFAPPLEVWDQDPEGLCLLHSSYPEKDSDGTFTSLINSKMAKEDYNFAWVNFPKGFVFKEIIFNKDVDFFYATFSGPTDFSSANFKGQVKFTEAKFAEEVRFIGTRFNGQAIFSTRFFSAADFRAAFFNHIAFFNGAEFKNAASFAMARFERNANFSTTTFLSYADFNSADFLGGANFNQTQVSTSASFISANFSGNITFSEVKFAEATFRKAILAEKARMYFQEIDPTYGRTLNKKKYHALNIDFTYMQIEAGASLLFQNISLSLAKFSGTDVSNMHFINVEWVSMYGRNAVYDEIILRQKKEGSYVEIELLYRQLKSNYEEKKDFKRVGDFHYGEMDMHRKATSSRRWFSWYSIYWALSGYGERPLKALVLFLAFFLGLSILIKFFGLTIASCNNPASLWQSSLFILDKATLQRPQWAIPAPGWSQLIASLSILVLPGQIALFFLALRNRLGRRR